jgi:hypothetical protein
MRAEVRCPSVSGCANAAVVLAPVLPAFVQAFDGAVFVGDFQAGGKAPQAGDVLEDFLGVAGEWSAQVGLVAQGEGAVAAQVYVPDLQVGLAAAEVVVVGEDFADAAVAGFVVDGGDLELGVLVVIENGEQAEVAHHLG